MKALVISSFQISVKLMPLSMWFAVLKTLNIIHVEGSVNPARDIETINLELIFSDIEISRRRISKVSRGAKNDKELARELDLLKGLSRHLEEGKMAKNFPADDEELNLI